MHINSNIPVWNLESLKLEIDIYNILALDKDKEDNKFLLKSYKDKINLMYSGYLLLAETHFNNLLDEGYPVEEAINDVLKRIDLLNNSINSLEFYEELHNECVKLLNTWEAYIE